MNELDTRAERFLESIRAEGEAACAAIREETERAINTQLDETRRTENDRVERTLRFETERAKTRAPAWRVQVPDEVTAFEDGHMGHYEENLARDCGDFFLRRADGVFAYQLAVVVDDALMGVDEVVRGSDLLSSTPRQLWLYRELGLTPPKFYHLPLLLASDGRRLSKRDGDQSLENLREKYTPEEIIGKLAFACGLQASPAPTTPQALARTFDWSQVPKSDIVLPENLF